jgi:AmmeMemoRadiSam system protein B
LLHLCKDLPGINARIIEYTHSGKVTRDNQQVVGYLSAVLYQQKGE